MDGNVVTCTLIVSIEDSSDDYDIGIIGTINEESTEMTGTYTILTEDSGTFTLEVLPHGGWSGPTVLDGGADTETIVDVPAKNHWYESSGLVTEVIWYSATVSKSLTYDIYVDDFGEGSGAYTGDLVLTVYQTDGSTEYGWAESLFVDPISITPEETTIYIKVALDYGGGSFCFAISEGYISEGEESE
jgi:hypothetical protein